jgi:hypothetical protein
LRRFEARVGREPTVLERKHISEEATLATRKGKSHSTETLEERLDRWQRESLAAVEGGLGEVARVVLDQRDSGAADVWSPRDVIERALAEVGRNQQTWTRSDLLWAMSNALPGHLDVPEVQVRPLLERLTSEALAEAICTREEEATTGLPAEFRLADGRSAYQAPGGDRYTTPGQVVAERILEAAATRIGAAALTAEQAAAGVARFAESGVELGADQAAAVRGVLTSGAQVEVLVAAAGSGKSFTVGAIAEAWAEHGHRTFGLAPSQVAADVLSGEGVTAFNIARWRGEQDRNGEVRLREGDLVVVDEAGMASTADLADVAQRCEGAGAKMLLVGDARQLAAVGPGGALADVGERAASYELTEVRRFGSGWEGEASLRLRDGDRTSLDEYDKHGRIRDAATPDQAEAAAGRAWLADTLAGKQSLLIVRDNEAAGRVSAAMRAELVRLGRVDEGGVSLGRDGTTAGVGDVVQARRNAWGLLGYDGNERAPINRSTYRVTAVTDGDGLRVVDAAGVELTLPRGYVAEHLTLAYASTVHAAQGRTVDTAHTVVSPGSDAAGVYVGLTRGRESNTAWVVTQPLPSDAPVGEVQDVEPRSGRAVLGDILERAEDQRGALAEQEQSAEDAASTVTNVDRLIDGIAVMGAGRTSSLLDRLAAADVITPEQRVGLAADQAMGSVERLLRHAEVSGHDPTEVLRTVLDGKSLDGSTSLAQVLHARVRKEVGDLAPEITSYADLIPVGVDEKWAPHLAGLAEAADDRRRELGSRIVEEAPQWALESLGPVPGDLLARAEWEQRAGWAAAYRENMRHDDDVDPLGAAPPAGLAEKHAVWWTAHTALDLPDIGPEEELLTDGRLRARVAAYERERVWAPRWVGDELAATSQRAAERRADAELWSAHAATPVEGEEPVRLAEEAAAAAVEAAVLEQQAVELEEADRVRGKWFTHTAATRDAALRAKAELEARGVDLAHPPDATTAAEWLAAHEETVVAEDPHRDIHDIDLAVEAPDVDVVEGQAETAVVDIRETAVADPSELVDATPRRRVPAADETAVAVVRAGEALAEVDIRQRADEVREADEVGERAARWHTADQVQEQQDVDTDTMSRL